MKIVLDTNILISAFFWQGKAGEIFTLAQEKTIKLCINQEILAEFQRVLEYPKFTKVLEKIQKTSADIISEFLEIVDVYPSFHFKNPVVKDDPDDDKFIACALASEAKTIVSGDQHLLVLKRFMDIEIISPHEFLKKFYLNRFS